MVCVRARARHSPASVTVKQDPMRTARGFAKPKLDLLNDAACRAGRHIPIQ
jgi:hypothetical protein